MRRLYAAVLLLFVLKAGLALGKTITVVSTDSGRNITLADNQVGTSFQFQLTADDTASIDTVHISLSVVEGVTVPGDRFIRSILIFDERGDLISEKVLNGEIEGDFDLRLNCKPILKNVPRTFSVAIQGGFPGEDRSNTVRVNAALSWFETDANVVFADVPKGDVVLGFYTGPNFPVVVRRGGGVIEGIIRRSSRMLLAEFVFDTQGEAKTIYNPTFVISSDINISGFTRIQLEDVNRKPLAFSNLNRINAVNCMPAIFTGKVHVVPGGTVVRVYAIRPAPKKKDPLAISANVSLMFPIGDITGMQTRAKGDADLVTGPSMIIQ